MIASGVYLCHTSVQAKQAVDHGHEISTFKRRSCWKLYFVL